MSSIRQKPPKVGCCVARCSKSGAAECCVAYPNRLLPSMFSPVTSLVGAFRALRRFLVGNVPDVRGQPGRGATAASARDAGARWPGDRHLQRLVMTAGLLLASIQLVAADALMPSGIELKGVRGEGRVLLDPSATLDVAAVADKFNAGEGLLTNPGDPLPAGGGQVYWYQLKLPEVPERTRVVVTLPYAGIDRVDFFRPVGLDWQVQRSGDLVAVDDWPMRNLTPVFRFDLEPAETRHTYLRVVHGSPLHIYWQVWDSATFFEHTKLLHMGLGAYAGLVMLLIVLSLV
ncbi:MAG: hypothetical protein EOO54_25740, partial [Haliea sp.]